MSDTTALGPTAAAVITVPEEIALIRAEWIDGKRAELAQGEAVLAALSEQLPPSSRKLVRVRDRLRLLTKIVAALERGYIPIPRFSGPLLNLEMTELPAKALLALAEAGRDQLFDEVRFIAGQEPSSPRGRGRRPSRDPLLVGVVRSPARRVRDQWGWEREEPGREEHFLIAFWRPEDERDETMF